MLNQTPIKLPMSTVGIITEARPQSKATQVFFSGCLALSVMIYRVTPHVKIEKPDSAIAYLSSKYRSCWMRSTTTPPPPIPPMVARAIITISTKVPTTSITANGEKRSLCSQIPSKVILFYMRGNISSMVLGLLCISRCLIYDPFASSCNPTILSFFYLFLGLLQFQYGLGPLTHAFLPSI